MTAREDVEIIKKVFDDVLKDLGIPSNHPVGRILKDLGDQFEKEVKEQEKTDTSTDYERAMKGIKCTLKNN